MQIEKRKRPTLSQQVKSLLKIGRCPSCNGSLCEGGEWDHRVPLALGGTNDDENWQILCRTCHSSKSHGSKATSYGSDIHAIAKVRRIQKKQAGMEKLKQKIPSRPWPKRAKT